VDTAGLAASDRLALKKGSGAGHESGDVERLRGEVATLRAAIALLHRISNLVAGALELEPACYAVLTAVTAGVGLGLNRGMLFLSQPGERHILHGAAAIGPVDRDEADRVWRSIEADAPDLEALYEAGLRHHKHPGKLDRRVRKITVDVAGESIVALAFRRGATVIGEGQDDPEGLFHAATAIAAPLRDVHGVSGVLYADNYFTGRRLDPIGEQVFSMVADHAGRAIGNARRFEEVSGAARTDALTGLRHHGAFMTDLFREVASAWARHRPLGVCMIDLDGFKQVNDHLGHLAGDELLAGLASRMRGVVRGGELLYRYGGDEFAALVPGADRAAAGRVAARIHAAVSGQPFTLGAGLGSPPGAARVLHVTCSVGVASLPEDAADAATLVAAADRAMFRAKSRGKNQVDEQG
jgi:diguanylate cyclase (GGDEF)-like protein